jgi:DNA-binding response OmpR family regulator
MKILVIDDEESVQFVISEMLKNATHEVFCLDNACEIEPIVKEEVFDLIITDLIMPGKNGADIILDIRKVSSDVPILAMSGGGRLKLNDNLQVALENGATDVLSKPFSFDELMDKVNSLIKP